MMKISSHLLFMLPLAFGIGIAMTFQTALNTQLREYFYSPLQAALLSFFIGTCVLALLVILQPVDKPQLHDFSNIPWYLWLGGCLGVYAISISIYTAPKLGFLTFSGLVIFGQILTSAWYRKNPCQLAAFTWWRRNFYWCASHFTTLNLFRPST